MKKSKILLISIVSFLILGVGLYFVYAATTTETFTSTTNIEQLLRTEVTGGKAKLKLVAGTMIFITSERYDGNLGGIIGGDAKCQTLADAANLGGIWHAWLSDSTTDAKNHCCTGGPYYRVDGTTIIVNDDADLLDNTLINSIYLNEKGEYYGMMVQTGTRADGTLYGDEYHCNNWTSNLPTKSRRDGHSTSIDYRWSHGYSSPCDWTRALFCFQQ